MPTTHTMELTGAEAAELEAAARAVLDDNWLGASTVPSRTLYPHQWSWDSAFIAIGRSWYDQQRAQTELETLFNGQWVSEGVRDALQTQVWNVMERRARMAVPRMLGRQSSLAGAALQRGSGWGVLRRQRVVV